MRSKLVNTSRKKHKKNSEIYNIKNPMKHFLFNLNLSKNEKANWYMD